MELWLENIILLNQTDKLKEFPKEIKFKYSWRKYQQRVLDELQEHLSDDHLHVIAPPGSGKTVLGLEVALRLNKPTLILAPSLAIRNQWIHRFCDLFLQSTDIPDWISKDIRNPKFMTVITYQGLHAACCNADETEEELEEEEQENETDSVYKMVSNLEMICKGLKSQGVKTIIVDEAHHLKNQWWQTLTKVKEKLDPIIVGLTATPPYDVTESEWSRYIELNGPVDTEISVPELVKEGDLCPHQDYVHFTLPTENEQERIKSFREKIELEFIALKSDENLISAIELHPIWQDPESNLDWIYDNVSIYSAVLIFLNSTNRIISPLNLAIIGAKKEEIPLLNYSWMEILLDFYLYKDREYFKKTQEVNMVILENRLKQCGAIEKKEINFIHNKRITGFLSSSESKLTGIKTIVDFEYKQLGKDLRMVVLTDFIRKEFLPNPIQPNPELNKIGVIPIFEKLRRENSDQKKIAVLSGSIVILPINAMQAFKLAANEYGISQLEYSELTFDSNYILINQSENLKHHIVHLVTHIFQAGEIEILIGTKSLLGEGWDAPSINALILASFVGSFVLSNQMRGRAIRTQHGNASKTGNIWHLVCFDLSSSTGGDDFELLSKRFKSFVGIGTSNEHGIENGINRLDLNRNKYTLSELKGINEEMFANAADRKRLKILWEDAIDDGDSLVEEIKLPFKEEKSYKEILSLHYSKTISNFMITLLFSILTYCGIMFFIFAKSARHLRTYQDLLFFLIMFFVLGVILFTIRGIKALRLYLIYRDIAKDIHAISEALVNGLFKADVIHTSNRNLKVVSSADDLGAVYCHLEGGTTYEKSIFIIALKEILAPINNPRYIIIRKNKLLKLIQQKDYHAVPELLGKNKILAEYFNNQWQRLVGDSELVFTRTIEGRKLLLKSRTKSLAAQFENEVVHINKWK